MPERAITLNGKWNGRFKDRSNSRHPSHYSALYNDENGMCCLGVACHTIWDIPKNVLWRQATPQKYYKPQDSSHQLEYEEFLRHLSQQHSISVYAELVGRPVAYNVITGSEAKSVQKDLLDLHKHRTMALVAFITSVNDSGRLTPHQKARAIKRLFHHFLGITVTYEPSTFE